MEQCGILKEVRWESCWCVGCQALTNITFIYVEHNTEDFAHNNPILSKRKTSGSKHRKTSEDKTGKPLKKASTASAYLQGIPEGQILKEEQESTAAASEGNNISWKPGVRNILMMFNMFEEWVKLVLNQLPSNYIMIQLTLDLCWSWIRNHSCCWVCSDKNGEGVFENSVS